MWMYVTTLSPTHLSVAVEHLLQFNLNNTRLQGSNDVERLTYEASLRTAPAQSLLASTFASRCSSSTATPGDASGTRQYGQEARKDEAPRHRCVASRGGGNITANSPMTRVLISAVELHRKTDPRVRLPSHDELRG